MAQNRSTEQDLCLIATIVAAHGVGGAVRLRSHSDIPGRFERLKSVLVGTPDGTPERMSVRGATENGDRVILTFVGCDDRDVAEALVGCQVWIEEVEMEAPPEGRYFVHDLIGCEVYTPEGEARGRVHDVMLLPANDVYVVRYEGREVLVPAVPAFIRQVDTEAGVIVVEPVAGLFEDLDED